MNKEYILGIRDHKTESVHVPEWDCTIYLRSMTGRDRARLINFSTDKDFAGKLNAFLLVLCCCDESGNLLFTEKDIPAINERSFAVLERLGSHILDVNACTGKAVKDAEKNSPQTQN